MTSDPKPDQSAIDEITAGETIARQDAEARFSQIGKRLRKARQKRGMSLAEVATQLHLPSVVIDDIEQGRLARLAPLYRRGYVSNYARLFGLDEGELLDQLGSDAPPQLTRVLPVRSPRFRFDRYMRLASYLIVTIAIVPPLVMIYLNAGSDLFHDGSGSVIERLETQPPAAQSGSASTGDEQPPIPSSQPVAASALPLSGIRPLRDPAAETIDPISPASELAAPEPVVFELMVRLKDDSWVEITDGEEQRLEYDLLRAGQERVYRGEPPFRVLLGRSSAVELWYDGQPLRYDGDERANVATLVVQQDGQILR